MKSVGWTAFLVLWVLLMLPQSWAQLGSSIKTSDDIAVAVNSQNPISEMSLADLRKILLGERRFWKGNVLITLVLRQSGTRERDVLLNQSLKMNDVQFTEHWHDKVFRGEAPSEPLAVPSNGMASEYVADTQGAIAFIAAKNLRSDLKVLKIEGKLPGEQGYPLR